MSDMKVGRCFSPFSSLPSQVGWEMLGLGEVRVVRDALRVRCCSSGSGVKAEWEKRPPGSSGPPAPKNIHRAVRWGRGGGDAPTATICVLGREEGKNKPENDGEWEASIGNDGGGGFFLGGRGGSSAGATF